MSTEMGSQCKKKQPDLWLPTPLLADREPIYRGYLFFSVKDRNLFHRNWLVVLGFNATLTAKVIS